MFDFTRWRVYFYRYALQKIHAKSCFIAIYFVLFYAVNTEGEVTVLYQYLEYDSLK